MKDEVLERLRQLNLAAPPPSWAERLSSVWFDPWNVLLCGMVLASVCGMVYLLSHV